MSITEHSEAVYQMTVAVKDGFLCPHSLAVGDRAQPIFN